MNSIADMKGPVIFGLIVIIATIIGIFAYGMSGNLGIEDRYKQAVGLPAEREEGGDAESGFPVEGNPVLYFIILGVLLIVCFALYYHAMR